MFPLVTTKINAEDKNECPSVSTASPRPIFDDKSNLQSVRYDRLVDESKAIIISENMFPMKPTENHEEATHRCPIVSSVSSEHISVLMYNHSVGEERLDIFTENIPLQEETDVNEDRHDCPICRKEFSNSFWLETHIKIHTVNNPHVCSYCHQQFSSSSDLQEHLTTHSEESLYPCPHCGKGFKTQRAMEKHILIWDSILNII